VRTDLYACPHAYACVASEDRALQANEVSMTVMMSDHEKYGTVELKNQTVSDIVVQLIMSVNLD